MDWNTDISKAPKEKEILVTAVCKGKSSVLVGEIIDDEFSSLEDEFVMSNAIKGRKIVAWMPMPEPYRKPILSELKKIVTEE